MEINFKTQTPAGEVEFHGMLNEEEVEFLLRYAVISLMARGALPVQLTTNDDEELTPEQLN